MTCPASGIAGNDAGVRPSPRHSAGPGRCRGTGTAKVRTGKARPGTGLPRSRDHGINLFRWTTNQLSSGFGRRLRDTCTSRLEHGQGSASMALTSDQVALIGRYFKFYRQLDLGERTPETEAQRHFVEVCRGRKPAVTPHEFAYTEFKRSRDKGAPESKEFGARREHEKKAHRLSTKAKPPSFVRAGPARPAINRKNVHLIDPRASKPWARHIDEPTGSREDFERDSGRNRSRARQPK